MLHTSKYEKRICISRERYLEVEYMSGPASTSSISLGSSVQVPYMPWYRFVEEAATVC
jgi:hypothetical protein